MLPSSPFPLSSLRVLLPVAPYMLVAFLTACSPDNRKQLAAEFSALTSTQPAEANSIGWQQHQSTDENAFTMVGSHTLNQEQLTRVQYLQWPQSFKAIDSLLGIPAKRSDLSDSWLMPNGHYLTIYYSGGKATGYSLSDSGG